MKWSVSFQVHYRFIPVPRTALCPHLLVTSFSRSLQVTWPFKFMFLFPSLFSFCQFNSSSNNKRGNLLFSQHSHSFRLRMWEDDGAFSTPMHDNCFVYCLRKGNCASDSSNLFCLGFSSSHGLAAAFFFILSAYSIIYLSSCI